METIRDPNFAELLQSLLKMEPHQRPHRFEELLSLWMYPGQLGNAGSTFSQYRSDSPVLSAEERKAWTCFIQNGEAWEPRTNLSGIKRILQLQADSASLEQLIDQKKVLVIGTRVACRHAHAATESVFHTGYKFELGADIELAKIDICALEGACRKNNATLRWHNSYAIVSELRRYDFEDDTVILLSQLLSSESDRSILALWKKAKALGVHESFIALLPPRHKKALADTLSEILMSAMSELGWEIDLTLDLFSEGASAADMPELEPSNAASRFECHLHVWHGLEQFRKEIGSHYYESVVKSLVLTGSSGLVANTLAALPLGRCLYAGIAQIQLYRPSWLASMCRHPSWQAEGIAGMLKLSPASFKDRKIIINEWHSAQFLMRNAVLENNVNPQALRVAIRLAVHDEQAQWLPSRESYSRTLPAAMRMALWRERLREGSIAEQLVTTIKAMLDDADSQNIGASVGLIIFSLRILEILNEFNIVSREELANSIAISYDKLLKTKRINANIIVQLESEPPLLLGLMSALILQKHIWSNFMRPFDFLREVLDKPLALSLLSHARVLIALCTQISDLNHAKDILDAITHIISFATSTTLPEKRIPLFDYQSLSMHNAKNEPWLVVFGQLLAKLPDIGRAAAMKLVRKQLPTLGLSYILWGAGSEFSPELMKTLAEMVPETIEHSLTLDHLRKLCTALYHARQYQSAEAVARQLIQRLDEATEFPGVDIASDFSGITVTMHTIEAGSLRRHPIMREYANDAEVVIAASLIQQNRHEEIINRAHGLIDEQAVNQIKNLQAIAYLYSGQLQESQNLLHEILKLHPKDVMALSNIVSVHMAQKQFHLALRCCATAKEVLGPALPDVVKKNEVLALWHLNDIKATDAAIKTLPSILMHDTELTAVRVQLVLSTSPIFDELRRDIDLIRAKDPRLAKELDSRLAPLSELEIGAATYGGLERRILTFTDKCKRLDLNSEDYLNKQLQMACHGLAEHPALTCELNEDQLTQLLMWRLDSVLGVRSRVRCEVRRPGGHGPKREGEADFGLLDQDNHDHSLVLGEAKIWNGKQWGVDKGMRQVFAVNNTGASLFTSTIIYAKNENFDDCVRKTQLAIKSFEVLNERNERIFQCVGEPSDCTAHFVGHAVKCFRSTHRILPGSESLVTLYCILVDLSTDASKAVRAVTSSTTPRRSSRTKSPSPRAKRNRRS